MSGTLGPGINYGRASRYTYIATAGQTTFSGADSSPQALTMQYTPGYVEVAVNGVWLPPSDYTATNGSSIVLPFGCVAGDIVYAYCSEHHHSRGRTAHAHGSHVWLWNVHHACRLQGYQYTHGGRRGWRHRDWVWRYLR